MRRRAVPAGRLREVPVAPRQAEAHGPGERAEGAGGGAAGIGPGGRRSGAHDVGFFFFFFFFCARPHTARARFVGDNARLRAKFIAHAKAYVGTPYAERYHKPGDALHGLPLYLDCCALVRRAVQELRADFGFDIGSWNQAYQFATCPTEVRFPETARPGDLLFVQGTYFKGRKRPQKMDVVHVEIFLGSTFGTGPESTLSSRDHYGCVQVHDSFRYESPWYEITGLRWRSLDDWLEGRCDPVVMPDSFRDHDPYGDHAVRLGKRSVFDAPAEAADDDDGPAADDA